VAVVGGSDCFIYSQLAGHMRSMLESGEANMGGSGKIISFTLVLICVASSDLCR
jgi:hypothetical protein